MIQYVADNIQLFGRPDGKIKKILDTEGKLFCPESVDYEFGHEHDGQPLLSFDNDGKCSVIPQAGTLIFVRFPDGRRECFESRKPLIQKEIAEAVCICGICRNVKSHDPKIPSGKRSLVNISWIGVANNLHKQDFPDTLAKRIAIWFDYGNRGIEPTEANLKKFMLQGVNQPIGDMHS
jgi:hypothetical protein